MSTGKTSKDGTPLPADSDGRSSGTGEGADSAFKAMLKKLREGEHRGEETAPPEDPAPPAAP